MTKIWFTWEKQRRNSGIAAAIGARLCELISDRSRLLRYLFLGRETLSLIKSLKPQVVVAQNPSIVLATLAVGFRRPMGYTAVIDAHNSGIFPSDSKTSLLRRLSILLQRHADLTIVTNRYLARHVEDNGGRAFVLPDRLPKAQPPNGFKLRGDKKVLFICTFSSDEPFEEVFTAAGGLDESYTIFVTGKYQGKVDREKLSQRVVLLGYLSEEDYWGALHSADVVMDLTTREDCLVCGAYEGISVAKPLVLSDTRINREYFDKGCVYVAPASESIREGVVAIFENVDRQRDEILRLKGALEREWDARCQELLRELESLASKERSPVAG
ncbi:glycosyltransferase family protein [Geomonas edaphica]|uniref:glycosyltransferase n=1 Tax=Geomonas edaphica TaxID=2570226 RepID=UPI0010A90A4D|nr:glycosyltransferase [Geomonas edaphica]